MSMNSMEVIARAYGLTLGELQRLAESGMDTFRSARRTAAWLRAKFDKTTVAPEVREAMGGLS